jgi:hypothetical protein
MPVVAAAAAALGATPVQAAIAEGASWVLPPVAYYGYKRAYPDKKVTPPRKRYRAQLDWTPPRVDFMLPYQQPGTAYNRKRFRAGVKARRAARAYGPFKPKNAIYKQPRIRHHGDIGNNQATCVVALHDLRTADLNPQQDLFFCVQPADILQCPGLARYRYMYDRMRFLKIKVEAFSTDFCTTMITAVSQTYKTTLTDKNVILRQPSCRFHNLKRSDGQNCQRTFDVSTAAGIGDHISTSSLSDASVISAAGTTQFDCGIHGCILHTDVTMSGNPNVPGNQQKVQLKYVFVVEFLGQKQQMQLETIASHPTPNVQVQ